MKTRKITKAIFPVAGLGTRFLPATKSIPKEIMTLVDRPLIQYAIDEARAGDIIALVSLQETDTGDTLCDSNSPVILERMRFPEPVISVSVKPKNKAELEKFMVTRPCPVCGGKRLRPEILAVTIGELNVWDVSTMSIS